MAVMFVHGPCVACRKLISYHPDHVPSLPLHGVRCAICESCFHQWNEIHRTRKGLDPLPLHPKAYEPKVV
jgi:hypothetical protein